MAKAAKTVEVEITERMANKFVRDILERFENIESARGTFMNKARREREAMATIYEGMAARGVSQKAAKANIKIVRALEKIKGWMTELEAEDRKMTQRLAKAQGDKKQLMLFGELPPAPKPTKEEKAAAKEARKSEQTASGKPPKGASGDDLAATETAGQA
jgi:predicted xylose isomerase-like sugar epimerase